MSFGNYYSLLDMYPNVDKWLGTISGNMAGSPVSGYRATRTTFQGSLGTFSPNRQSGGKPNVSSMASLNPSTELDQAQGQLTATGRDTDYAIQGQGYFLLEDANGAMYLTRNGEFKTDDLGQLNAGNGLRVVTKSRLIEKGILQPTQLNTTNANDLINRGEAGWQWAQKKLLAPTETDPVAGGQLNGIWFPYLDPTTYGSSAYNETPGSFSSYKEQVVAMKRTYDLGTSPLNATAANSFLEARSDDWSHIYINGTRLTAADAIDWNDKALGNTLPDAGGYNQGGPLSGAQFGQFVRWDVSRYLRPGMNTITMVGSEVRDYEGINIYGQLNGQTVRYDDLNGATAAADDTLWLSKILGTNASGGDDATAEPVPSGERFDRAFERGIDDLAIVTFPDATKLKYSRFGTNYLEVTPEAGAINYEFSSADAGNGKVKRGFIENANTTIQTEMSELSMAQRMYQAVTGLVQLQMKAFQRSIDMVQ
jgi:flagellar hook-basal body protein